MKTLSALGRYKRGLAGLALIVGILLVASIWAGHALEPQTTERAAGELDKTAVEAVSLSDTGLLPDRLEVSGEGTTPANEPTMGLGGMTLKVIGSVAFVIGILYIGMHVMRAMSRRGVGGAVKQDAISVMHKKYIAPKKAIYVVKIAERAMVVGVTDSQINHLADLTQEELDAIKVIEPKKSGDFKRQLLGFALGMKGRG
jgi:flagellar biogenesis protein FliO